MLIMLPEEYLLILAENCPKALGTYIRLWRDKNPHDCRIVFTMNLLEEYGISKTKLISDLNQICDQMLLSYKKIKDYYLIELVDYNEIFEDDFDHKAMPLC
jgi:hypothetical protein